MPDIVKSMFLNVKTGRIQSCRLEKAFDSSFFEDPITASSGCGEEFAENMMKNDRADGCPQCIEAGSRRGRTPL